MARIDDTDRKILRALQEDAGRSLDEIAKAVGSSKTPVWNRIRKMREAGIIGAQTVQLDAEKLGFEACFFVLIRTSEHDASWQKAFLHALKSRPEVQEAHRLAGDRRDQVDDGARALSGADPSMDRGRSVDRSVSSTPQAGGFFRRDHWASRSPRPGPQGFRCCARRGRCRHAAAWCGCRSPWPRNPPTGAAG